MNRLRVGRFERVSKSEARKLYESGKVLVLTASKISPESQLALPVANRGTASFDSIVNSFSYYNCTTDTGRDVYYWREIV